jgi:hypothetical protein
MAWLHWVNTMPAWKLPENGPLPDQVTTLTGKPEATRLPINLKIQKLP